MITGLLLQIGTVTGSVIAMPFLLGTKDGWWRIYAVEAIPLITTLVIVPFLHESPGYLLARGKADKARASLRFFHNCPLARVDRLMAEVGEGLRATNKSISMFALWRKASDSSAALDRRGTLTGCAVGVAMSFSGIAGWSLIF